MSNTTNVRGKKLLILSGNALNCNAVNKARELGIHTVVVDYLSPEKSPAKRIADEHWEISYMDCESIIKKCKEERIDGIYACSHDETQHPYYEICSKLGLPCYMTYEQLQTLTNKRKFKDYCLLNGISVIQEYSQKEIDRRTVSFPVMVKPTDSCGSKGISFCRNYRELNDAIIIAKEKSLTDDCLIEKAFSGKTSFQVTYFFIDGNGYVIRTTDGYKGSSADGLDRVALCSISPSKHTDAFLSYTNQKVTDMLCRLGIKNGPVMLQGFYDEDAFLFYDPGRRFPATHFELIYKELFGIDFIQMMIVFSLTGQMPYTPIVNENVFLNGKTVALLFPTVAAGEIGSIEGLDSIRENPYVRDVALRHRTGDRIEWSNSTLQRLLEVSLVCNSREETIKTIHNIQDILKVSDKNGKDMIYKPFDTSELLKER